MKKESFEYWDKLGKVLNSKDRAPFKLECCHYILEQVKKLEKPKTLSPDYWFKVELAADCFVSEIIGVMDSLLQEINDRMSLGLSREEVNENKIDKELKDKKNLNNKHRADLLQDIWHIKRKNWLWRLKQYRNMAVHRSPLHFLPVYDLSYKGIRFKEIRLQPVKGDPDPKEREVFQYFSDSLKRMRKMVESIEENLNSMASTSPLKGTAVNYP